MYPSVKTIMTRLEEPIRNQAELSPKQTAERIRHFMMDDDVDFALERINTLLGGYGVEAIRDHDFSRYYGDIGLLYVNMGDTYTPTVCYDTRKEKWLVCSWGDIVEKDGRFI